MIAAFPARAFGRAGISAMRLPATSPEPALARAVGMMLPLPCNLREMAEATPSDGTGFAGGRPDPSNEVSLPG